MKLDKGRKRNLVFYSGGREKGNLLLHKALSQIKGRKVRSMTYVPYSHENGGQYFSRIKKRYSQFGIKKFRYFPCDSDFLKKEMNEALKSDVIYLAGGNTFYFLKHLRQSGLLPRLKKFVEKGGILAGLSAGAIIMTPHIYLAGYPPHEGDVNEVRLKNLKALDLVNFEFLPHYTKSARTNLSILKYSRRCLVPILACTDGSGIVVSGENYQLFGNVTMFYRGRKFRLT